MSFSVKTALAALILVTILAPVPAAADICVDDAGDDCCAPCGVECFCCAGTSRVIPPHAAGTAGLGLDTGRVVPSALKAPTAPAPRDILHVPKATLLSH